MDTELRRRMLAYYDERAPEYEEAYTLGTGTASMRDPEVFKAEAQVLTGVVAANARGRLMDLACGTAYWLPHYGPQCSHVMLFDQSSKMLAEARVKANHLGMVDRCVFLQGDFFDQEFDESSYDTALVGFFLSHVTEAQEPLLFDALRRMLGSSGRFLILDSAWSAERSKVNEKVERQTRRLNDGTAFEVYKRYCDSSDLARWTRNYGAELRIEHVGPAFYAVSGTFPLAGP
jgi:demethylmenaquinone methyltransferase/2-methoxy-6-polyprenyl-1,4-benzoquinol methylase